ncbi:MAG: RnfABCDGE type electron transport complex subunit D [Spirochaeta sp.]|nr:RnfABCDGE type electron transport complex subunit D [Spirochaeta sp.]
MHRVVLSLIPLVAAAVYFFGWRTLVLLAVVNAAGFLAEFLFARVYRQQVTAAVFVTNFLFTLILPPNVPLWIAVVGIVFGVIFGKMVFGGFGRNIFNPALSGRAFIYVSFGVPLTSGWVEPIKGVFGGFSSFQADVLSGATPLAMISSGEPVSLLKLFLGNTAGSLGETSALLILICGMYLLIKKTASFRIVLGGVAAFVVFQLVFRLTGVAGAADPLSALLSGSFLFGIMFMATDPISASQTTDRGRWVYGAAVGMLTVLIRTFSIWPEGITFAILLANMFAPLLDHLLKQAAGRAKSSQAKSPQGAK